MCLFEMLVWRFLNAVVEVELLGEDGDGMPVGLHPLPSPPTHTGDD